MILLLNVLIIILIISGFLLDYKRIKSKFILIGVPLVLYFIYIQPILSKSNISEPLKLALTFIMVVITLFYFFKCILIYRNNKH